MNVNSIKQSATLITTIVNNIRHLTDNFRHNPAYQGIQITYYLKIKAEGLECCSVSSDISDFITKLYANKPDIVEKNISITFKFNNYLNNLHVLVFAE